MAHPTMRVGRLLVFAAPLLWASMIVFHPNPTGESAYEGMKDVVDLWIVIHIGQLILTPFLFLAVWRLLDGLSSTASVVSRCALVVWTAFFSAYDSVQGVATGILTSYANGLAGEEQDAVGAGIDHLVEGSVLAGNISFVQLMAGGAWLTVAIAAAVALHRAGAGRGVVVATCISTVFVAHTALAAIGLVALCVAGVLRERESTERAMGAPAETSPEAA